VRATKLCEGLLSLRRRGGGGAWRFVAEAPSLDISGKDRRGIGQGRGPISLREVLLEMIHEYARHLGHADLLRERIDGRIGQ
jgi:hypothetical protein